MPIYEHAWIFVITYLKILLLGVLHNAIMHTCIFGQAYCQDLLRRIPMKFISYFFEPYCIFYIFYKFIRISRILKENEKPKTDAHC
jgi:hypothetical protein